MRTLLSLVVILLPLSLVADDARPETLTLRGKVVDTDGKPVAGAVVEIRTFAVGMENPMEDLREKDDLLAKTTADENGAFAFNNAALPKLKDANAMIRYYQPELIAYARGHGLGWVRLDLQKLEPETTVKLQPHAAVRGKVVDDKGAPIAKAAVRVVSLQELRPGTPANLYLNLHRSLTVLRTSTDDDGRFIVEGLPKETRLQLQISEERFVVVGAYAATTDRPQPKMTERYAAQGQNRTREEEVHIGDFTVTLRPGHRVASRVVTDDGKPGANTWVYLQTEERGTFPSRTDAAGRFTRAQLPPGKYTYTARPPEKSDYLAATGNFEIPAEKREVHLDPFKLPRGAIISGKVVDEDTGKGIAGVTVFYESPPVNRGAINVAGSAVSEPDGSFRLVVASGQGRVRIAGQVPGYFLQSQPTFQPGSSGTNDPFTHEVIAKLDEPVKGITFKLGKGLFVSGQVVDAEGKPTAGVKLFPFSNWSVRWDTPAATTDAEGKFSLSGLDPAKKHEVIAIHEGRKLAGRFSAQGTKDKKRVEDLKVRVEPQATMTGRVVDEDKKPITGASVSAYVMMQVEEGGSVYFTSFSPFTDRPVKTDKDGKFTCDYLIPGMQHSASVNQEGYAGSSSAQFTPTGGERKEVGDLTLIKADQSVAGAVVDPAGRPLAGIRVYATSRGGGLAYVSSEQVHTDKEGRFKVDKLPRGGVEINALSESDAQGISMSNRMNAQTGQTDVKIVMFLRRTPPPVEALVGKPAPEFPVASWLHRPMTGKKAFQPADFQGKVVVLAFVDEAKPSQRVFPVLQTLREKLGDKLVVLRVHEVGEADELAKLSTLPAAIVPGGIVPGFADAHQKYGARTTPTLFVIDRQGVLRHADAKPEELEAKVKKLLEG